MKNNISGKVILSLFLYVVSFSAIGQDYINEDFLDNIETNAKNMWADAAPAFTATSIPEKYNSESAVIMAYKRGVTFDKKSRVGFFSRGDKSLTFYENVRFKIKLNDKYSVQSFTEIFFRYRDKADGFSAHVTKPDGTTSTVSLNEAVGVESNSGIPEFFKSFFDQESGNEGRYFKVAIPGLEPGDILEYVTMTTSKLSVSSRGYVEFSPQYELCAKKYPILYNQISIETDDKSYFKSMSFNGAPEFKKEAVASGEDLYRYVFTDAERGVEKDVNFINVYQVYPMTKFQVIYSGKDGVKGALIGEKGEMKSGFSKEELAKKAWEDYVSLEDSYFGGLPMKKYISSTFTDINKRGGKNLSDSDYINKVYYWIRNVVLFRDSYLNDKVTAYLFGSLLYQRGIKSELVIAVSNSTGKLKDVLFDQEIHYVVKVGSSFYFNCTDHSLPRELVQSLLGADGYIIAEPAKGGVQPITAIALPDAIAADNTCKYVIKAKLDSLMSNMAVSRKSEYRGISKATHISDAMRYIPYPFTDYEIFNGNSPSYNMPSYQMADFYNAKKAMEEQMKEGKPDFVKSQLQGEYVQKVAYKDFAMETNGRSLEESVLAFTEDYELAGMVRKAGKKYLVNVAGLVGSQLQVKKDERDRTYDINVSYPRSLAWVINFKIPDGYTAEGLKELALNVDNETGSFFCDAAEEDGTVVLTITKTYKKANLTKDKWQDMLAFVDAAYNNSFKYILLKPKN